MLISLYSFFFIYITKPFFLLQSILLHGYLNTVLTRLESETDTHKNGCFNGVKLT